MCYNILVFKNRFVHLKNQINKYNLFSGLKGNPDQLFYIED
jgi:hypothetical protein